MKTDDKHMWDDPAEPSYVHELLEAGRNAPQEYDAIQGLATHLAQVRAGAPMPHWAQTGAGAGMSSGALIAWIAVPVVTASIAAGFYFRETPSTRPSSAPGAATQAVEVAPAAKPSVLAPSTLSPSTQLPAAVPTRSEAARLANPQSKLMAAHKANRSARPSGVGAKASTDDFGLLGIGSARTSPVAVVGGRTQPKAGVTHAAEQATEPQAETAEQAQPVAAQRPELDESRLEREMQMLAVAQRVLAEDPSRALRMAEQGEREFPKTMFSAERQQVALLAMVKLGRIDDARRIGQPFLAKYPNAPWSARLRRALATGRVE